MLPWYHSKNHDRQEPLGTCTDEAFNTTIKTSLKNVTQASQLT